LFQLCSRANGLRRIDLFDDAIQHHMSDVSAESNDSVAITIDRPDSACSSCNSRESDAERSRANSRSNDAADANATDAAGANGADADGATATATATANAATPHGSGPGAAS